MFSATTSVYPSQAMCPFSHNTFVIKGENGRNFYANERGRTPFSSREWLNVVVVVVVVVYVCCWGMLPFRNLWTNCTFPSRESYTTQCQPERNVSLERCCFGLNRLTWGLGCIRFSDVGSDAAAAAAGFELRQSVVTDDHRVQRRNVASRKRI